MTSKLAGIDTYREIAGHCTECGRCTEACPSLTAAGLSMGGIAKAFIDADLESEDESNLLMNIIVNEDLTQAVRGCFMCTKCQQRCCVHNDVLSLMCAAREDFQNLGLIQREAWSSVQVDQQWHVFSAFRAIYGIGYPDLTRHLPYGEREAETDCKVAFFPGCALAAYAPELTREVFETIEWHAGKATIIDHCCGSPLKSAGFYDRALELTDRIAEEVKESGAKEVVCVCPGCRNNVEAALKANGLNVRAITLPRFLLEHDFEPKKDLADGLQLRFSKSCQDRDASYLDDTRKLLDCEDAPAIIKGCCGAGGSVSSFNPHQKAAQIDRKLDYAEDGDTLVSMCPTCTYTFAAQLREEPRDIHNVHYLELMFQNGFDWDKTFAQLNDMWSGEYAQWLMQTLYG